MITDDFPKSNLANRLKLQATAVDNPFCIIIYRPCGQFVFPVAGL